MSVKRVEATKASCRVPGCVCHDRVPRYPSDLAVVEWALLRPEAEAVMAEVRRSPGGRPMEHDLRAVLDAIGYVCRYGIEWRALAVDCPPWEAVDAFVERWSARGLPQALVDRLRGRLRVALGQNEPPTAGLIDSPSVEGGGHGQGGAGDSMAGRRSMAGSGTSLWTRGACGWPWSSPLPGCRIVMGLISCWPCCASGWPRSLGSGLTAATPGAW